MDYPENLPGGSETLFDDYNQWLAHGKELAEKHSGYQWNIGDWLVEGESSFDPQNFIGDIPRHMLIGQPRTGADGEEHCPSIKIPNYWKDAAAEIGMAVPTLREYAFTSRCYPKQKRFKQLTYTHHSYAAQYDRRYEYLAACLTESGKPRSIDWLYKHIRENEGEEKEIESTKYLRFMVPEEMWAKLKDLGKHYATPIPDLVQKLCVEAIDGYLEKQAEKISLQKFDFYEPNKWPFDIPVAEPVRVSKRKKKGGYTRRQARYKPDAVFSKRQSEATIAGLDRKRAQRAAWNPRLKSSPQNLQL